MSARPIKKDSTNVSTVIRIVDDTDGTPETGVVWNTSGIDLAYRREGEVDVSITEATLSLLSDAHSDGGFLHIGNGYYRLDLPDAAVATGTSGVLVHGTVTGMVVIGTYHPLVDYDPQDSVSLGLTAVASNVVQISGDSAAADNLEAQYDGTGYTDENAPSSRSQVAGLGAISGGSINFEASEDNTGGAIKGVSFVGAQTNTYTNTAADDGAYHTIDDTANDIDIIYGFDVGGSRIVTELIFTGYLSGSNDSMLIQAYNFVGASWETRKVLDGQNGIANVGLTVPLLSRHTGTGADLGKVYIRFEANGSMSNPQLNVDELLVEAVNSGTSIGYEGGAVWIDTNASNTNTESYVDGTADNPVSTLAAATTIAGNLNLKIFHLLPNSSVTLAQAYDGYEFLGDHATVALGGQSVSGSTFYDMVITGNDDGSNARATIYEKCDMGSNTLGAHVLKRCRLTGDIVLAEVADYFWDACFSGVAGTGTPSVDLEAAVETKNLNIRHYSGGIEFKNFGNLGTHTASLEGNGQLVLNANCAGGTVAIRGNFTVTDNAGGAVTLSDEARFEVQQIWTSQLTESYAAQGVAPTAAQALFWIQQGVQEFAIVDTTLTVYKIDGVTAAGTVTLNSTTPTSRIRAT